LFPTFEHGKIGVIISTKMDLTAFWAIVSQTSLVTLVVNGQLVGPGPSAVDEKRVILHFK
jgi:hypothetical protein